MGELDTALEWLSNMAFQRTRMARCLLIDDDEDYRQLFASALKESGLDVELFEVPDGSAGLDFLRGNEPYVDRAKFPMPDLVFLDLAMKGLDGLAVLKDIRKKLGAQNLPVIVLSNSDVKDDVTAAYSSFASAFHRKPSRYRDLVSLLQTIIPLWLEKCSASEGRRGASRT